MRKSLKQIAVLLALLASSSAASVYATPDMDYTSQCLKKIQVSEWHPTGDCRPINTYLLMEPNGNFRVIGFTYFKDAPNKNPEAEAQIKSHLESIKPFPPIPSGVTGPYATIMFNWRQIDGVGRPSVSGPYVDSQLPENAKAACGIRK